MKIKDLVQIVVLGFILMVSRDIATSPGNKTIDFHYGENVANVEQD